jgi:hypothetical protein
MIPKNNTPGGKDQKSGSSSGNADIRIEKEARMADKGKAGFALLAATQGPRKNKVTF